MAIEVELPDGSIAEFPDGTPDSTIERVLREQTASAQPSAGTGFPGVDAIVGGATGILKGLGTSAVGAAELLAPPHLKGTFPSVEEGFQGAREALKPQGPAETGGYNVEQFAEFFAPGAAGLKAPKIAKAGKAVQAGLQGALESGFVGSLQEGELNPEAAALGSIGGGVGNIAGRAAKFAGDFLGKSARDTYAKIIPAKGSHQAKVTEAIERGLERGDLPTGNIEEIAKGLGAQAEAAGSRVAANRAGQSGTLVDIDQIMKDISARLEKTATAGPGGFIAHDPKLIQQARPLMEKLIEIRRQYGSKVPAEVLEKQRDALSKMFQRPSMGGPEGSTAATEKLFHREMLRGLNRDVPGRQAVNTEFNMAQEMSTAADEALMNAPKKAQSSIGEGAAVRAVLGGAAGTALGGPMVGAAGSALGALGVPAVINFMKSATYRSWSATKKHALGKAFEAAGNPEAASLVLSSLGGNLGSMDQEPGDAREQAQNEIIVMLQNGDRAGARQRALRYRRDVGGSDMIDTRALEAALYSEEPQ